MIIIKMIIMIIMMIKMIMICRLACSAPGVPLHRALSLPSAGLMLMYYTTIIIIIIIIINIIIIIIIIIDSIPFKLSWQPKKGNI